MKVKMLRNFEGYDGLRWHFLEENKTYEINDYWSAQFIDQGLAVLMLEVVA